MQRMVHGSFPSGGPATYSFGDRRVITPRLRPPTSEQLGYQSRNRRFLGKFPLSISWQTTSPIDQNQPYIIGFISQTSPMTTRIMDLPAAAPEAGKTFVYTVSDQRIPMPDGVELRGDLYQPDLPTDEKPRGLLYVLGPYGRRGAMGFNPSTAFRGFTSSRGKMRPPRPTASRESFLPRRSALSSGLCLFMMRRSVSWTEGRRMCCRP